MIHWTCNEIAYLLERAKLRLSPPQLDEMTRTLTAPDQVTPLALTYWQDIAADWCEDGYEAGKIYDDSDEYTSVYPQGI